MKWIKRPILVLPSVLSLIVCAGVIAMWGRSYRVGDFMLLPLPTSVSGVWAGYLATGRGGTALGLVKTQGPVFRVTHTRPPTYGNGGWSWATEQFGFDAGATYVRGLTIYAAVVPDCFLFLLSAGAVGVWLWPGVWRKR